MEAAQKDSPPSTPSSSSSSPSSSTSSSSAAASSSTSSAVAAAFALPPPPATLLDGVLQSIATPGAGPGLVAAVNGALLLMLAATGWIAWRLDDAFARRELLPLLGVGAALALGLLVAFNAFVALGGATVSPSADGASEGGRGAAGGGAPRGAGGSGDGAKDKTS